MANDPSTPDHPIRLRGRLLLADPSLREGIFNRSVILLAEHDQEQGAFGLILNHPTGKRVGDFLTDSSFGSLKNLPVHEGGPVSPEQLTFSAFWWENHVLQWKISVSAKDAIKLSSRPGTLVRAFIGYSGWSSGQLENELRRRSWVPVRPGPELLSQQHDRDLWADLLRPISPLHRILAEAPDHPFLN